MKILSLPIDSDLLNKMFAMSTEDMHELVETVGYCASINEQLHNSPENKILTGMAMAHHALIILEQCGCKIELKIHNDLWTECLKYTTENNVKE